MVETTGEKLSRLITEEKERARLLELRQFRNLSDNPREMLGLTPEPEFILPSSFEAPLTKKLEPVDAFISGGRFAPLPIQQATVIPQIAPPKLPTPPTPTKAPSKLATATSNEEEPLSVPFWQRALQIFATPFVWVDENVIKPGLGTVGTATGLVPEAERLPGEDFFEWKRRSWANLETRGIDMNVPWSEEKVRLDFKGVLELAPWLLIPGAGQVGAGVRAARGVAGVLGKLGPTGKALGIAVEYSPWGLVEKGVGATFKGIGKLAGGVSARLGEKAFGKIPEKTVSPVVEKFTNFMNDVVIPQEKAFLKELPTLRARQSSFAEDIAAQVRSGALDPIEALSRKEGLAGGIKSQFTVPTGQFSGDEVRALLRSVYEGAENGLVSRDAAQSLHSMLLGSGELLAPRHFRELGRVFGDKFALSVRGLSTMKQSTFDKVVDFLNIPRPILSSTDISAVARQGLILGVSRPKNVPVSFGRMIKALFSEKSAIETDAALRATKEFREFTRLGGYWAPIEKSARAGLREEAFITPLTQRVPFVRRSERAFVTYLNSLRHGAYRDASNAYKAQGAGEKELRSLTRFIDMASGRGEIPKSLEKFAPALNTILFSPRLQAATLELPRQLGRMLLSGNPYERKEAARALVTFLGGGAGLITLLQASGVADETSTDPRAGDFGKIKIGETRFDIWRGYVQYIRFISQLMSGERISAYGNLSKAERDEIAWRFLQSKSSPAFGLLVDLLKGENFQGEPLFEGTTGAIKTARNRFMPLAIQDMIDAIEQNGETGAWVGIPAALGVGSLTYVNDFVRVKQRIAREEGFTTWDEIDPKTRREIENRNVELQAAQIDFDRQVMGTAFGDWRNAGKAIEDVFIENVDQATAQYRATLDGVQYREKITDAFTERRGGFSAREREERFEEIVKRHNLPDTAEALVALGPEQLAIKSYFDALFGDDMYDEFGDYRFDEARIRKEQLREQLGEEMFAYVEEYQGMKFENLPPEFQQLQQAREILRPYFEVRTIVEQLFGKVFAESNAGKTLISKRRRALRLSNPEMNQAWLQFYSRT